MTINKIEQTNEHFKLPIHYNKNKLPIKENIITDLELVDTIDLSNNSIYNYFFNTFDNTQTSLTKQIINQSSKFYTNDIDFLKDNQKLLKNFKSNSDETNVQKYDKMIKLWNEIKGDTGFKERSYYIDWPMWEFLNKSQHFLQFMSIYNMTSPVISLFVPIIILIIPFFIIRLKGLKLTLHEYIDILKVVISQHSIGKLFTQFGSVTFQEKIYLLVSAGFYMFSIYQNILVCYRFHENMKKIHNYFNEIKLYLHETISSMKNYTLYSKELKTHIDFNETLQNNIEILSELKSRLDMVSNFQYNFQKISEIGHILKTFYEIYDNKTYETAIMYSFGFNGYIDCITGLQENIAQDKVSYTKFTTKSFN